MIVCGQSSCETDDQKQYFCVSSIALETLDLSLESRDLFLLRVGSHPFPTLFHSIVLVQCHFHKGVRLKVSCPIVVLIVFVLDILDKFWVLNHFVCLEEESKEIR